MFSFIILAIGALALYVEFNHPGAVVPGTIGMIFILLAAFAMHLLPIRYAAIAMILVAFAPVCRRGQVRQPWRAHHRWNRPPDPRSAALVDSPIPEMRVHLLTALAVSVPLGLITAFLMGIAVRARRNKIVTGEQGLVGEIGIAETALAPPEKFSSTANSGTRSSWSHIPAGERVVVVTWTDWLCKSSRWAGQAR